MFQICVQVCGWSFLSFSLCSALPIWLTGCWAPLPFPENPWLWNQRRFSSGSNPSLDGNFSEVDLFPAWNLPGFFLALSVGPDVFPLGREEDRGAGCSRSLPPVPTFTSWFYAPTAVGAPWRVNPRGLPGGTGCLHFLPELFQIASYVKTLSETTQVCHPACSSTVLLLVRTPAIVQCFRSTWQILYISVFLICFSLWEAHSAKTL